jgi:hypothetical protein
VSQNPPLVLAKYEEQIILDFTVAAAVGNPAELKR